LYLVSCISYLKKAACCLELAVRRFFVALFQYLNENQNGKNDANQCIQTDHGTEDGEKDTDEGDLCQQTDDKADYLYVCKDCGCTFDVSLNDIIKNI
jgi:hypothetical protein